VILNGHEYVACRACKAGLRFSKEGNCFTTISDAAGLAKIADTLSEPRAIGRLSQVCERRIYSCLCFALDFDEQSAAAPAISTPAIKSNTVATWCSRWRPSRPGVSGLDRPQPRTIGPEVHQDDPGIPSPSEISPRAKRSAEWELSVEKPAYDLTIFKLHCGKLTLKIYSKCERVLRIEAVAHKTAIQLRPRTGQSSPRSWRD